MMKSELELDFLDEVCGQVSAQEAHAEIRRELGSHLEDLIAEREVLGESREQAIAWALAQMGEPRKLGRSLHQVHKPRIPWGLLAVMMLMSIISLLVMSSIQFSPVELPYDLNILENHSVNMVLGIVLMVGFYFIDYRKIIKISWLLYGASLGIILLTMLNSVTINGKAYYMHLMMLRVNLISFTPYLLLVAVAGILIQRRKSMTVPSWQNNVQEIAMVTTPALAYAYAAIVPELATYLVAALILYTFITRKYLIALASGVLILGGTVMLSWMSSDYVRDNIIGAINPQLNPDSSGFIYNRLRETISTAGWWGHGFGVLPENLPYVYTDTIAAYLIYSFGWGGGLILISIGVLFFSRLVKAIRAIRHSYGQALVLAMAVMLGLRLAYGLATMSGRMVLTSIPFPFLSYGSHIIFEYAALGLLMGIYRRKDIVRPDQLPISG
ncbi:FtsW/RodA/SpoVE family cell cycle protein [Paenibacillus donghaensis]|nr:FtsW/RodA/SpoVE family cell cycle protein [Paenibacillus donghaensis]